MLRISVERNHLHSDSLHRFPNSLHSSFSTVDLGLQAALKSASSVAPSPINAIQSISHHQSGDINLDLAVDK
jgi:hypothetical protein